MILMTDLDINLNFLVLVRNIYAYNAMGTRRFPSLTVPCDRLLPNDVLENRLHAAWDKIVNENGLRAPHLQHEHIRLLFADVVSEDGIGDQIRDVFLSWHSQFAWLYTEVARSISEYFYTRLSALTSLETVRFHLSLVYDTVPPNYLSETDRHLVIACTPLTLPGLHVLIDQYLQDRTTL